MAVLDAGEVSMTMMISRVWPPSGPMVYVVTVYVVARVIPLVMYEVITYGGGMVIVALLEKGMELLSLSALEVMKAALLE